MTGGELACEICSPFEVPTVIGFQPLYAGADGRPCQVIVHDYARDHIDALKLHHPVTVERGSGPTDTVSLLPLLGKGVKYTSSLSERMKPADLTETLLRMWRMPDLTEWYRRTHGLSDNAVSLPPPPPAPPPEPPTTTPTVFAKGPLDRLREADERRKKEEAEELLKIGDTINVVLGTVPGTNGKHRKK